MLLRGLSAVKNIFSTLKGFLATEQEICKRGICELLHNLNYKVESKKNQTQNQEFY